MTGPVLTHNFDVLAARAGLAECFVRRYDQMVPDVEFVDGAKALLVIGLHADRRQVAARARGMQVIHLDPEGFQHDSVFHPYPLEGPQDGDLVCNAPAHQALPALAQHLLEDPAWVPCSRTGRRGRAPRRLGVAEMDVSTSPFLRDALERAVALGETGYGLCEEQAAACRTCLRTHHRAAVAAVRCTTDVPAGLRTVLRPELPPGSPVIRRNPGLRRPVHRRTGGRAHPAAGSPGAGRARLPVRLGGPRRADLARRVTQLLTALRDLPLTAEVPAPEATYLVWAGFPHGDHAGRFAEALRSGGVHVLPGEAFGGERYGRCFRINAAAHPAVLDQAFARVRAAL
ncbi:aminotransferase class I/II-fold pyridoxal phosphate-dependent enzyme [Streptomyces sclerotialus]|uniref:aminotransferase class I/II-fold pyridoxal phosphate-dependent enzyme n=1 Tax=Streptomyces sclerotialus TaxID=1957 RepID=UPI0007C4BF88